MFAQKIADFCGIDSYIAVELVEKQNKANERTLEENLYFKSIRNKYSFASSLADKMPVIFKDIIKILLKKKKSNFSTDLNSYWDNKIDRVSKKIIRRY